MPFISTFGGGSARGYGLSGLDITAALANPFQLTLSSTNRSRFGDDSTTINNFFSNASFDPTVIKNTGQHFYDGYYKFVTDTDLVLTATAKGAAGNRGTTDNPINYGRSVTGKFSIPSNTTIVFFAGKIFPPASNSEHPGAGGASAVMIWDGSIYVPLVVGAAGSSGQDSTSIFNAPALSVTSNNVASFRQNLINGYPVGEGRGGVGRLPVSAQGGGAGFYGDGLCFDGSFQTVTEVAKALDDGALGQVSPENSHGGFGGGGADNGNTNTYGAGGGGYWGAFETAGSVFSGIETEFFAYTTDFGNYEDDRLGALSYVDNSSLDTSDNGENTLANGQVVLEFS